MDRTIEVKVSGNHLTKDSKNAGVRGEANVTTLRITFDEGWDGYSKKITFWDARGGNPTKILLGQDRLENRFESERIYLVSIPQEPLKEAGRITFVIDGYIEGLVDSKIQRSLSDTLEVKDAPYASDAENPVEPTPELVHQYQVQVEKLTDHLSDAIRAKEAIRNMNVSAETLLPGEDAYVEKGEQEGVVHLHFGIPEGEKGDKGDSGVHVGESAPTDPEKVVWIAPNGGENPVSLAAEDYVLTASDKEEIAEIVKQKMAQTEMQVTLSSLGWQGTSAPYVQTVNVGGVTADTQGEVFISEEATDEQFYAATYAMLRKTAQGTNSITMKAYGEMPMVDIPLTVRIGG